jgi:RNA polymerase sigma-70 factor (ECF subfamily)
MDPCMDDRIAISRLKQADFQALETLVHRYQVQAVQAAYLIVRDRALAEDVVQNAFLKAAERIHQFNEERPFGPWFYRIVVNDAVKLAEKQKRTVSLDEQLDERVTQTAAWLRDPSLPPEQLLEQAEMRTVLLDAMQALVPEQRAVIVMRYFLEMSEADMSARMDRPLSTIKWWLRDARKRLRHRIRASQFEEGS